MPRYEQIRKNARLSREKVAARANVTSTTCRVFELGGPAAVKDSDKSAALVRIYDELERAAAERGL